MLKTLRSLILSIALLGAVFIFRPQIENGWMRLEAFVFPCKKPISYSIGSFDARFDISKDRFMNAISEAEKIWEQPIEIDLFAQVAEGGIKINLIYDFRQEATEQLQKLDITYDNTKASYDKLKAQYESLEASYLKDKTRFNIDISLYEERRSRYDSEVEAFNRKGGASREDYNRLLAEKSYLDAELARLKQAQSNLNAKVEAINALAVILNQLANSLNIAAAKFNQIGDERGEEFTEGVYESNHSGQKIEIYQFDSYAKLVRVLAHEFGHALGLDHLDDPKAIMYRLNQGTNGVLAPSDLAAIKRMCGVD